VSRAIGFLKFLKKKLHYEAIFLAFLPVADVKPRSVTYCLTASWLTSCADLLACGPHLLATRQKNGHTRKRLPR
jgi:hypothetical protein